MTIYDNGASVAGGVARPPHTNAFDDSALWIRFLALHDDPPVGMVPASMILKSDLDPHY